MTIEKTIYNRDHYIYIDSIEGSYNIGDVVKFDRNTCKITSHGINMCELFGLVKDGHNQPIENGDTWKQTIDLGDIYYTSDGVRECNGALGGKASAGGSSLSVEGENGITFTRDDQFVVKFIQAKSFRYGTYDKEKIEAGIRRNIIKYESGSYGLVHGRLECKVANLCFGYSRDCVLNVAANAKLLERWTVKATNRISTRTKIKKEVPERRNAVVGVFIYPFTVGSKKDLFYRSHTPKIIINDRGYGVDNNGDSGKAASSSNETPGEDNNLLSDEFDVQCDEEEIKCAMG